MDRMKEFYQPTENPPLRNFHFRALTQLVEETFPTFCNRVVKEAKHCHFKCQHENCTAEEIVIRDQIVIGMGDNSIRDEVLKKSWDLQTLRKEGMKMESAARSGAEISGEAVNKIGKYSFKALKNNKPKPADSRKAINFCNCGSVITRSIAKHKVSCPAKNAKCKKCGETGHFVNVCKSMKKVNKVYTEGSEESKEETDNTSSYHINIFHVKATLTKLVLQSHLNSKQDFKVQVVFHNSLQHVIADTGARISVRGTVQAKNWGLLGKICSSKKKINPYNNPPLPVYGEARCSVTFGHTTVPLVWHIISGSWEPILDGNTALQLGIISFKSSPDAYQPILMIN